MYNVLIVEDDIIQANAIKKILQSEYKNMTIFTSHTYSEAIDILDNNRIHLFILDIILDSKNNSQTGIHLGTHIRNNSIYTLSPILYITSIPDQINEAVNNIHCYNYLTKPYNHSDLIKAVSELINSPLMPKAPIKFHDLQGIIFNIKSDDLIYVKSEYKVLAFHTINCIYKSRDCKLEHLLSILSSDFVQCHKSYIINTSYISNYDKTTKLIRLGNNTDNLVPVGRKYKEQLEKRIL